jgi:hypothetical protein
VSLAGLIATQRAKYMQLRQSPMTLVNGTLCNTRCFADNCDMVNQLLPRGQQEKSSQHLLYLMVAE